MRKQALINTYLDQTLTTPGGGMPPDRQGYVFGTVTYGAGDWNVLLDIRQALIDRLTARGVTAEPGYAVGFLQSFIEPVVYAAGMGGAQAAAFARSIGLQYYLGRTANQIYVLSRRGKRVAEAPPRFAEQPGTCVMPNPNPSQACGLLSRPYGGSDRDAGLEWRRDRVRLVAALGCRVCDDGALSPMPGGGTTEWLIRAGEPRILLNCATPTRYTTTLELPHD